MANERQRSPSTKPRRPAQLRSRIRRAARIQASASLEHDAFMRELRASMPTDEEADADPAEPPTASSTRE